MKGYADNFTPGVRLPEIIDIAHLKKEVISIQNLSIDEHYYPFKKYVHTVDTKTVAPPFFTIGSHSKWVMQKLLCWFP